MTTTGKIALFVGGTLFGSAGFKLLANEKGILISRKQGTLLLVR